MPTRSDALPLMTFSSPFCRRWIGCFVVLKAVFHWPEHRPGAGWIASRIVLPVDCRRWEAFGGAPMLGFQPREVSRCRLCPRKAGFPARRSCEDKLFVEQSVATSWRCPDGTLLRLVRACPS